MTNVNLSNVPHKQRKPSLSSLFLWPSRRSKVLCRWGWYIIMSFSCERQRNIITLTLDFHFSMNIFLFFFHFRERYSSFSTTEEKLHHIQWCCFTPNYDLLLEWNMKHAWDMPFGSILTTVHCNHTAWQAAISILLSATTQPSKVSAGWALIFVYFICHMCWDNPAMWKPLYLLFTGCYDVLFDDRFQEIIKKIIYSSGKKTKNAGDGWAIMAPFYWRSFSHRSKLNGLHN